MSTPAQQGAVLREATQSDLTAVEALLSTNKLPLGGVAESLASFVVAEYEGGLVGVAGIEHCGAGEHALLRSVAVADAWKGKGLGRALVERAIRDAVPAAIKANVEFTSACPASAVVMVRERPA